MKGFPNPSNPFSFEGNDAFERCSFLNVCDSWPESPRWPITVTTITNTSRENQTPQDTNNYFKEKPNISRQKQLLDGKTNRLTAEPKAHGKLKYLTAKPNTSRQKQLVHGKTDRLTAEPKAHGKNNYFTANPNTSRQTQILHGKPKYFTAKPIPQGKSKYLKIQPKTRGKRKTLTAKPKGSQKKWNAQWKSKTEKRYRISGYWTLTVYVNAALLGLL